MFHPDLDIEFDRDQAWLSARGRRHGISRAVLFVAIGLTVLACIVALASAFLAESRAGAFARRQIDNRLQADGDAEDMTTAAHYKILTSALRTVLGGSTSKEDQAIRIANLQGLFAHEKRVVAEGKKSRELIGQFEPRSFLVIDGKRVPLNDTTDGKYRTEVVVAFMKNLPELAKLLEQVNRRALAEAPLTTEQIIERDLARDAARDRGAR